MDRAQNPRYLPTHQVFPHRYSPTVMRFNFHQPGLRVHYGSVWRQRMHRTAWLSSQRAEHQQGGHEHITGSGRLVSVPHGPEETYRASFKFLSLRHEEVRWQSLRQGVMSKSHSFRFDTPKQNMLRWRDLTRTFTLKGKIVTLGL